LNSKLKYHLPVLIFCLGIFIESSFPTEAYPKIEFELSDKIIHFGIYFALFLAFYYSFNNQTKYLLLNKYSLFMALAFTSIYGASDELHQYFVPGRSCDIFDWLADVVGAILGVIFILIYKKYSKTKIIIP
jgi:VanZ family protein